MYNLRLAVGALSLSATLLWGMSSQAASQLLAGNTPWASLAQGPDGSIYGSTWNGGGSNACGGSNSHDPYPLGCGTIFRIDPAGTATTIFKFRGKNGMNPGPLGVGSDGNIYGAAGSQIFTLTPAGAFKSLGSVNGTVPNWGSLLALNGKFYTALEGANAISSFGPGAPIAYLTSLATLKLNIVEAGLTLGSDGALYGPAYSGGPDNLGAIFKVTLTDTASIVLPGKRSGPLGQFASSLATGSDGTLYGVAQTGISGQSSFFSIDSAGSATVLNTFSVNVDGSFAGNGLVFGGDGNLYGAAFGNGTKGGGTLTQFTTGGGVSPIFQFGALVKDKHGYYYAPSGQAPSGAPLAASDGSIWGTTTSGGHETVICHTSCVYYNGGVGTVWQYTPATNTFTTVVQFTGK